MRLYETGVIFHPELPEDRLKELIERIEGEIEKGDGKIAEINQWGLKKLAYRIQQQQNGYYTFFKYAAPSSIVNQLEYQLRVLEGVLRFLTIKLEQEIDEQDLDSIQKVHKKPEAAREPEKKEEPKEEVKEEAKEVTGEAAEVEEPPVEEPSGDEAAREEVEVEEPPAEKPSGEEETREEVKEDTSISEEETSSAEKTKDEEEEPKKEEEQ